MMAIAATEEGGGHRLMHRQASAPDGLTLALRQLRSQGVWVVWQRRLLPAAARPCWRWRRRAVAELCPDALLQVLLLS